MGRETGIWNRTRLRFALIGALCCLLAAVGAELLFARMRAGASLRSYHTPSLLFLTEPAVTTRIVPAPPPPPDTTEMQRRLQEIGAQSGEVQVSLAWNNNNDLDLSCLDPNGELIDGYNQTSRSGGVLDVDMNPTDESLISPESRAKLNDRQQSINRNRRSNFSDHPVENIVWTNGNAPIGHYKVFVHQFCNKEQVASTPYWVEVRVHGQIQRINGAMGREDFADQGVEPKLIYEFDVKPRTAAAPVRPTPAVPRVPAPPAPPQTITHTAYSLGRLDYALTVAGLWGLLLGLLPVALFYGQRQYLRLPLWAGEQDFIVCAAGPVTGFLTAIVAQVMLSLLAVNAPLRAFPLLLVLCWTLLGGLFGYFLSLFTPNLSRIAAPIAGLVSALAASLLFQLCAAGGADTAGRIAAGTLLGAAIGILIALPEREPEPEEEKVEERPERPHYETQPPFIVRGTRSGKVGGLRRSDRYPPS